MYYTIQNGSILKAETEQALTRYYNNVKSLPVDYEEGKYIVENNELVLNPNFEQEKQEQEREQRNQEIDNKIKELREMSLIDIMNNNEENIKLYNDVILGLEESRP